MPELRQLLHRGATATVWASAAAVVAGFVWILVDLVTGGLPTLSWAFLVESPEDAGRSGGIGPILVSTLLILGTCLAVATPLAVATAAFVAEFTRHDSRIARLVRRSLDILAGVPSIVFGLFGYSLFCIHLGLGTSILSGGLTLACMALPIMVRTTEEGLRAVPNEHRLGAAALGLSRSKTLWHILLPAAAPGLAAGFVLGLGRAIAETAALIFTSGYVTRMPESLLDSGRSLSIHIYDLSMNVPRGEANACATALVLLLLLLGINSIAFGLTRRRRPRHS